MVDFFFRLFVNLVYEIGVSIVNNLKKKKIMSQKKIMFHSYFERKNDKVLTFNIAHLPNFEISASH